MNIKKSIQEQGCIVCGACTYGRTSPALCSVCYHKDNIRRIQWQRVMVRPHLLKNEIATDVTPSNIVRRNT